MMWPFKRTPKEQVLLKDDDGTLTITTAHVVGGQKFAYRINDLIRLLPNGRVEGSRWTKTWESLGEI